MGGAESSGQQGTAASRGQQLAQGLFQQWLSRLVRAAESQAACWAPTEPHLILTRGGGWPHGHFRDGETGLEVLQLLSVSAGIWNLLWLRKSTH